MPQSIDSDWSPEIASLLGILSSLSHKEQPCALIIDEFQRVVDIDHSVSTTFKTLVDQPSNVSLIFAGSQKHVMHELAGSSDRPLFSIGHRVNLMPIPQEQMTAFLRARTGSGGKSISRDAAAQLCVFGNGIPNYVQQLAYWAFAESTTEIDSAGVERALGTILRLGSADYEESFARVSAAQQRVLLALARGPVRDIFSRRFVTEVDVANPSGVRKAMRRLEDLELVDQPAGGWRVANPFFARWLQLGGDVPALRSEAID